MAKSYRTVLTQRVEHVFPVVPDVYQGRVIQDLWTMCSSLQLFKDNARLLNGLRYLVKFEPYGFIELLEGSYDPYHVHGWGLKSFEDFERGRSLLLPRIDDYFQKKDYMKGVPAAPQGNSL